MAPSAMQPMDQAQHASSLAVMQLATAGFFLLAITALRSTRRLVPLAAWFSSRSGTSGSVPDLRSALARE